MANNNDLIKKLGYLVQTQRKKLNLTQTQLAHLAGVSLNFVSQLEQGKPKMQFTKLLDVMLVLGLQLNVDVGSKGILIKSGLMNEK